MSDPKPADPKPNELKIERQGGLAGFGLSNSRIRSRGTLLLQALSPSDRQVIESLFAKTGGSEPDAPARPDAFRYQLTMVTPHGEKSIVVPEHQVPEAVRDSVQDELV